MKKIKVLIIATDPSFGMIPFVTTIANTLADDNRFEIYAIVTDRGSLSFSEGLNKSISVKTINYPVSLLKRILFKIYPIKLFNLLESQINEIKPDVIHFMVGEYVFANYLKKIKSQSSLCLTIHDLHPHERKNSSIKDSFIFKNIIYKGYKKCEKYIPNLTTSSSSQYEELKRLYPSKCVTFTHFPTLVTEQIKQGKAIVKELLDVDKYILFFGSVDTYKGVDLLISAFCSIENTHNIKLVIAGKGKDYNIENNKNIIRLNRFIKDEEVGDLFRNASFVVYPYISATMSGVLSIAYYFRKHVLLSDVPFFKENATPSCTLFRTGDKEDLKNKIKMLLDQNIEKFTEDYYSKMYSKGIIKDDYFNLYKKIIIK